MNESTYYSHDGVCVRFRATDDRKLVTLIVGLERFRTLQSLESNAERIVLGLSRCANPPSGFGWRTKWLEPMKLLTEFSMCGLSLCLRASPDDELIVARLALRDDEVTGRSLTSLITGPDGVWMSFRALHGKRQVPTEMLLPGL